MRLSTWSGLCAAAVALSCATPRSEAPPPKPLGGVILEHPPKRKPPLPAKPPEAQPEPPPAEAAAPECSPAAMELVAKGQAIQRERGEDGAAEAIAQYGEALKLDPACGAAMWESGWSQLAKGDPKAAVDAWDALKAKHPDYPGLSEHYDTAVRRRDQAAALQSLPPLGALPEVELVAKDGPGLKIAAVGDVHMGRAWPEERAAMPPDNAMHLYDAVKASLQSAQVTFGNLETVLADSGESQKCGKRSTKCFAFRVPKVFANALKDTGFDVMSIANNHAGDFGPQGRTDTMAALDKVGIKHSGPVGDIAFLEVGKQRIALAAFSHGADVYRTQEIELAQRLVSQLAKTNDLVFVSFHGGAEGKDYDHVAKGTEKFLGEDRGDVRAFSRAVIDAGADLVLGHGPHVLRGLELYKGRLIAYSMGNFSSWETFGLGYPNNTTGIFHFQLAPNGVATHLRVEPIIIEKPGTPVPDPQKKAIEILRRLSREDFGDPLIGEDGTWSRKSSRLAGEARN
jgi:hypothetical protein